MHYMAYIASGELGGTTCSSSERKSCPMMYKTEKNLLNMDKTSRTVFIGKGTHSPDTLLKNSAKVTTAYPWIGVQFRQSGSSLLATKISGFF